MLFFKEKLLFGIIFFGTVVAIKPPGYIEKPKEPDENPPKYEYGYSVSGDNSGQGHKEQRDGEHTKGSFYVNLAEGAKSNVAYIADDWGFHPVVKYSTNNGHSQVSGHFALGHSAVQALHANQGSTGSEQQQQTQVEVKQDQQQQQQQEPNQQEIIQKQQQIHQQHINQHQAQEQQLIKQQQVHQQQVQEQQIHQQQVHEQQQQHTYHGKEQQQNVQIVTPHYPVFKHVKSTVLLPLSKVQANQQLKYETKEIEQLKQVHDQKYQQLQQHINQLQLQFANIAQGVSYQVAGPGVSFSSHVSHGNGAEHHQEVTQQLSEQSDQKEHQHQDTGIAKLVASTQNLVSNEDVIDINRAAEHENSRKKVLFSPTVASSYQNVASYGQKIAQLEAEHIEAQNHIEQHVRNTAHLGGPIVVSDEPKNAIVSSTVQPSEEIQIVPREYYSPHNNDQKQQQINVQIVNDHNKGQYHKEVVYDTVREDQHLTDSVQTYSQEAPSRQFLRKFKGKNLLSPSPANEQESFSYTTTASSLQTTTKAYSKYATPSPIPKDFLAPLQAAVTISNDASSQDDCFTKKEYKNQNRITEKPIHEKTIVEVQKSINIKNFLINQDGHYHQQSLTTNIPQEPRFVQKQNVQKLNTKVQYNIEQQNHDNQQQQQHEQQQEQQQQAQQQAQQQEHQHQEQQHQEQQHQQQQHQEQQHQEQNQGHQLHHEQQQYQQHQQHQQQQQQQHQYHQHKNIVHEQQHHVDRQQNHQQNHQHQQYHQQQHIHIQQPQIIEKHVQVPVHVERVVEKPVPYPVEVKKYVDRPYPVQQIVEKRVPIHIHFEKKIPVPYPVEKIVEKPVHHTQYIDRPYPVEKIVEKEIRVPYPVEKVVEKYIDRPIHIETKVPVNVPVEKEVLVEKIVEKFIDRPVPYPIEVKKFIDRPYPVEKIVEKIVDRPVEVEKIVEKEVKIPYPVQQIVEKIVDRPYEVQKIVEKPYPVPYRVEVEKIVDRPYPVEKIVEKKVHIQVPVEKIVEKYIDRPYPVEKIVEKEVRVEVPVEKIVEKFIDRPYPVDKFIDRPYPVEKIVEKIIDRPVHVQVPVQVPVHYPVQVPVQVPIHVPYPVEQKVHVPYAVAYPVHVPYKEQKHPIYYKKTVTTGGFNFNLFGRHNHEQKATKHVLLNKPQYYDGGYFGGSQHTHIHDDEHTKHLHINGKVAGVHHNGFGFTKSTILTPLHTSVTKNIHTEQPKPVYGPPGYISGTPIKTTHLHVNLGQENSGAYNYAGNFGYQAYSPPDQQQSSSWNHGSGNLYKNDYIGPVPLINDYWGFRPSYKYRRHAGNFNNLRIEYGFKPPMVPSIEINEHGEPVNKDHEGH